MCVDGGGSFSTTCLLAALTTNHKFHPPALVDTIYRSKYKDMMILVNCGCCGAASGFGRLCSVVNVRTARPTAGCGWCRSALLLQQGRTVPVLYDEKERRTDGARKFGER